MRCLRGHCSCCCIVFLFRVFFLTICVSVCACNQWRFTHSMNDNFEYILPLFLFFFIKKRKKVSCCWWCFSFFLLHECFIIIIRSAFFSGHPHNHTFSLFQFSSPIWFETIDWKLICDFPTSTIAIDDEWMSRCVFECIDTINYIYIVNRERERWAIMQRVQLN